MPPNAPPIERRPPRRLTGQLAVAAAFINTGILWELVPCLGSEKVSVRLKTASAGGALDLFPCGPDVDPLQPKGVAGVLATLAGTVYVTSLPTQVAIVTATENVIEYTCKGENFLLVKFTGSGTGTITYCDVMWTPKVIK